MTPQRQRMLQIVVCMLFVSAGAGCSNATAPMIKTGAVAESLDLATALPLLALPPHALGYKLSEQQQVVVIAPDGSERHLHALLEVDGQQVRLALAHMGQVMASLVWDGQQLQVQRSPYLPAQVRPERVLSDLQLALWPMSSIASALPAGWQVQGRRDGSRTLLHEGVAHIHVGKQLPHSLEIKYVHQGWMLKVIAPSLAAVQAQGEQP